MELGSGGIKAKKNLRRLEFRTKNKNTWKNSAGLTASVERKTGNVSSPNDSSTEAHNLQKLLLLLLLNVVAAVSGDSPVPVSGFLGEQVVLPCTYKVNVPVSDLLVVWETAKGKILHKFIAGNEDLTEQDPRFRNRTNLFKDQLGRGNWPVLISDLRESDQNQYICDIYKWISVDYKWKQTDIIHLSVTDSGLSTGARVGLGIGILVFLAAVIGFVIRKWQRRNRHSNNRNEASKDVPFTGVSCPGEGRGHVTTAPEHQDGEENLVGNRTVQH
ncbi:uncharacterized protein LOC121271025 isoform X2 [Carcharodon carcharias]|uniref:uncharacterized protein LOC121271025 isoform X2 n=1 Tax=Carcharodon carcharias TaxID=13397 RepID=UPI001B7F086B|nr:uncharacterized protein LOC121271025 isoform X2 [Carcharodon carcharias]